MLDQSWSNARKQTVLKTNVNCDNVCKRLAVLAADVAGLLRRIHRHGHFYDVPEWLLIKYTEATNAFDTTRYTAFIGREDDRGRY